MDRAIFPNIGILAVDFHKIEIQNFKKYSYLIGWKI